MTVTTEASTEVGVPTIELIDGMPGFPTVRSFALVRLDETGLLFSLRSLENPELRFLVMPPVPFFPDYHPEIEDEAAGRLGLEHGEDAMILLVVTVGESAHEATANLFAPIIVNSKTLVAAQVMLTGSDHPLRAALHPE